MGVVSDMKKMIKNNGDKKAYFVKWYVDSDKSEEDYNKTCKNITGVSWNHAMQEWLIEKEVQATVKYYLGLQRNVKLLEIFDSMYDKALTKGDVNSAKWVTEFFQSNFFEDSTNEIEDYLSGIDIPALKSGGK